MLVILFISKPVEQRMTSYQSLPWFDLRMKIGREFLLIENDKIDNLTNK